MMDYLGKDWSIKLVKAVAEGLPGGESTLRNKLLRLSSVHLVGRISTYFIERYWFLCCIAELLPVPAINPQSKVLVTGNLLELGSSFRQHGIN